MSSVRNRSISRRLVLAAVLAGAAAGPAAANVLVVRSSGPSARLYPAGRSLPDTARITLRSGDTVVILDARGTRTFRGPGNFNPATAARAGTRIAENGGRRARIGAVRSAGIVASPTTIWHIDVSQSGTMCLAGTSNVMLWRPEAGQTTALTISGPGGASRSVQWPAGRSAVAWPSDLPIADGGAYQFRQAGVAVPTQITFRTLNSQPSDMQAVAAALIQAGCQEQLDLLVDSAPNQ